MVANAQRRQRRVILRLQYGLRAMFVLTTVVAVWIGVATQRAREQAIAVRGILGQDGEVCYDFQERSPGSGRFDPKAKAGVPEWLVASLGVDFFSDVVFAQLGHEIKAGMSAKGRSARRESAVEHLPGLRNLRHLVIFDLPSEMTDESMRFVGKLHNLEVLMLVSRAPKVTDAGISQLAELRKLKILMIRVPSITDESLKTLGNLRSLEQLSLPGGHFNGRGLKHFSQLDKLRVLDLSYNTSLDEDGIAYLSRLDSLQELRLSNTGVGLSAVKHLTKLPALRQLDLSGNDAIDERAVVYLAELAAIEDLNLQLTRVNLTRENVDPLKKLRVLARLSLRGTGSDCGAVQSALPRCSVDGSR